MLDLGPGKAFLKYLQASCSSRCSVSKHAKTDSQAVSEGKMLGGSALKNAYTYIKIYTQICVRVYK